jgi:hypothetical protein
VFHVLIIIFQADFIEVTGKPLVLGLRRKVYFMLSVVVPASVTLGVSLQFSSFELSWWQNIMVMLCCSFAWIMSWLFIFTCGALSATVKNIGHEMTQVLESNA